MYAGLPAGGPDCGLRHLLSLPGWGKAWACVCRPACRHAMHADRLWAAWHKPHLSTSSQSDWAVHHLSSVSEQAYWEMRKLVVTPNVPNFVNISNPLDTFKRPVVPLEQRKMLMYFSGRCGPYDDGNLGKLFRQGPGLATVPAGHDPSHWKPCLP